MTTYIIKCEEYYKIGRTKNLKKRLSTYKTHNPIVKLIKTFDGDYEKSLHKHFKKHRIDKREWFRLTEEDIENINISDFQSCENEVIRKKAQCYRIPNEIISYLKRNYPSMDEVDSLIIDKNLYLQEDYPNIHKFLDSLFKSNVICFFVTGEPHYDGLTHRVVLLEDNHLKNYLQRSNIV